jgi:outer membrane protein assembly factor BamD (BamD/ComL family)
MNFSFQSKFINLLCIILISTVLSGCGIWDNFTTYFNLYYNASELFVKAEKEINAQEKDLFSTEPPNIPGSANSNLVKVIEKCSDLLQFSSESAYVPEALLMLGKSFYYQKNYQKSLRKFREFEASYSESDLILEAGLWIGKCQMRLKDYNQGLTQLATIRKEAIETGEDEIIRDCYIEEIVYRITLEDYKSAIAVANEFMEVSNDDEVKAQVWFEIGKLNMNIGDIESAITAFENVFEHSPDFDLQYNARLNYGIALREGNRSEDAMFVFEEMRSEAKYLDDYSEIDFEIAKTNRSLGNLPEAILLFTSIDTTYKSTSVSGAAKYELGQIFEHDFIELDSAASYYSKAAITPLPADYVKPAREKNILFKRYLTINEKIKSFNKQLFYIEQPEEFIKDSIAYVEDSLAIADEIANLKDLQAVWAELDSLMNLQDTTGFFADTIRTIDTLMAHDPILVKDSVLAKVRNPLLDDMRISFRFDSVWNSPESVRIRESRGKGLEQQQKSQQNKLVNQLPDTLKFKNNPPKRPTISEDSLHTLLAKNELELGNLYLTELNLPDSARWYYYNILNSYPNTSYQANTLYALGSYYLTVDNKQRADSLFNVIYNNYQNESIVNAAAEKLNKPFIDLNYDPAAEKYNNAENVMNNENYNDAIGQFYNIYETYPESPFAAQSLYTSGWILENKLSQPDSAASFYDTLIVHYPTSIYVKSVAGKLSTFKQEKRRLELAEKDSLNQLNLSTADSLAADSLVESLVDEFQDESSDTTQVSLADDKQSEQKKQEEENISTVPTVKEPLWNPRKRR